MYNDRVHSATKVSPFYADTGRHPYKGTAPTRKSNNPTAQEFAEGMTKIRQEIGSALKKAAEDMKRHYDKKRSEPYNFKKGNKVLLEGTNIKTD